MRPMSSTSPIPWALIAARTSGASAIRSTSCWAWSLASSRLQTSSTSSQSIASSSARLTASLSSAPSTASSTSGPSSTRAIARSTAWLSTAATIASSAATSTARSIPVARVTVRAPRTPTPSRRAESGVLPFWDAAVLHLADSNRSSKRSRSSAWAGRIFSRAAARSNHSARSTSGNSCSLPLRGGHSIAEGVALQVGGIELRLRRPGLDHFSRPLADRAQLDQLPGIERRRLTQLLFELADRAGARLPPRASICPFGIVQAPCVFAPPRTGRRGGREGTRPHLRRSGERGGCRRCACSPSTRVIPTRVDGRARAPATAGDSTAEFVGDEFRHLAFGGRQAGTGDEHVAADHHPGVGPRRQRRLPQFAAVWRSRARGRRRRRWSRRRRRWRRSGDP